MYRPFVDIVTAAVMLDTRQFTDAKSFIEGSRRYAAWSGIDVLTPHLERVEGAEALLRGDLEASISILGSARQAFHDREMPWELARTDLWLAEAHIENRHPEEAASAIESARPVLESLGSLLEVEQARSLLERL
jgi:hypothetical protein